MQVIAALVAGILAATGALQVGMADQAGIVGASIFGCFVGLGLDVIIERHDETRRSWWIGGTITATLLMVLCMFNNALPPL